eukprot:TRINITY_DN46649_c0_g1_i1.p1 TRINITY_DN46649_c0_g1~~TRINITY_DN46649_c0_g1_i1.p1  ORF type:complete len:663 (+),score=87.94 TRINITY_DN46649_c0_g1_i1:1-1989(+)
MKYVDDGLVARVTRGVKRTGLHGCEDSAMYLVVGSIRYAIKDPATISHFVEYLCSLPTTHPKSLDIIVQLCVAKVTHPCFLSYLTNVLTAPTTVPRAVELIFLYANRLKYHPPPDAIQNSFEILSAAEEPWTSFVPMYLHSDQFRRSSVLFATSLERIIVKGLISDKHEHAKVIRETRFPTKLLDVLSRKQQLAEELRNEHVVTKGFAEALLFHEGAPIRMVSLRELVSVTLTVGDVGAFDAVKPRLTDDFDEIKSNAGFLSGVFPAAIVAKGRGDTSAEWVLDYLSKAIDPETTPAIMCVQIAIYSVEACLEGLTETLFESMKRNSQRLKHLKGSDTASLVTLYRAVQNGRFGPDGLSLLKETVRHANPGTDEGVAVVTGIIRHVHELASDVQAFLKAVDEQNCKPSADALDGLFQWYIFAELLTGYPSPATLVRLLSTERYIDLFCHMHLLPEGTEQAVYDATVERGVSDLASSDCVVCLGGLGVGVDFRVLEMLSNRLAELKGTRGAEPKAVATALEMFEGLRHTPTALVESIRKNLQTHDDFFSPLYEHPARLVALAHSLHSFGIAHHPAYHAVAAYITSNPIVSTYYPSCKAIALLCKLELITDGNLRWLKDDIRKRGLSRQKGETIESAARCLAKLGMQPPRELVDEMLRRGTRNV